MNEVGILGVFCGAATLTGMLLALNFFLNKNNRNIAGIMLGLLFLAISLRIAKSILYFALFNYSKIGIIAGFISLTIIGPTLFFYMLISTNRKFKKHHFVHLIWPIIGVIVAFIEPISFRFLYIYATRLIFLYVLLSAYVHFTTSYKSTELKKFNTTIWIGVLLINISFFLQNAADSVLHYSYGAALSSLVIYYLSLKMSKSFLITNVSSSAVPDDTLNKVRDAIEHQKIFLRPRMTLAIFSHEYSIPTYLVTRSVNAIYAKSFPETINHFRIGEVKRRLKQEDNKRFKIEAIAAEAGFTTPSAFYTVFKKETGMTPTQFQKSEI
jgi:AraC-like DNA-binding protein